MSPDNAPHAAPWVVLARLIRPQGRRGEILSEILTDFPERFEDRKRLCLIASETSEAPVREVALEDRWLHKGRIVLKFTGIDSIGDADALRGLLVAVPESERTPLSDGSVYIADLIGCAIFDLNAASARVGIITGVDREAGLLQMLAPGGKEVLVPFARAFLVTMDLSAKRIEMRLPEGLLDINAPMTDEERRALHSSGENQ